jgi:geranylgeranylglycerol-phosphate geranylgeranyltransferase
VSDLLRLVRAHNLVVAAAGILAGGWIALGRLAVPAPLVWAALSGVGLGTVGNVLNDIWDEPGDRANARGDRPLASGRLRRGTADLLVFWGTLVGVTSAALVNGTVFALALVCLVLMAAYSPVLKRRGLPGNLTVAAVAGFPLVYGALAVGRGTAGLIPWVLAAWLHFGRELLKDLSDVPGDRALSRRTVPIAWGEAPARRMARAVLLVFVPVSLILPALAHYGVWYFPATAVADGLVVAAALAGDRLDQSIRRLKLAMPVGVVALVLGRLA